STPKRRMIWCVNTALTVFERLPPDPNLLKLSQRCSLLLALATSWRPRSDLARISFSRSTFSRTGCHLVVLQSTESKRFKEIVLRTYNSNAMICPVELLTNYVFQTSSLRKGDHDHLFISTSAPHGPASPDSIGRWIVDFLETIGVSGFSAHSTR